MDARIVRERRDARLDQLTVERDADEPGMKSRRAEEPVIKPAATSEAMTVPIERDRRHQHQVDLVRADGGTCRCWLAHAVAHRDEVM